MTGLLAPAREATAGGLAVGVGRGGGGLLAGLFFLAGVCFKLIRVTATRGELRVSRAAGRGYAEAAEVATILPGLL